MAITLNTADFTELKNILSQTPDFLIEANRHGFLLEMLQDSPRQANILGSYSISGPSDNAAVRLISWLCTFGKDKPDRESLALLVDALLNRRGDYSDAGIFLRSLYKRYPLHTVGQRPAPETALPAPPITLTPQQEDVLQRALLQAFTFRSLERMLWSRLGKDLEHIRLGQTDLPDVVFHLVKTARLEGWQHDLIRAAWADNPGNAGLEAFVKSLAV